MPIKTATASNERTLILADFVNRFDDNLMVPIWSVERIQWAHLGKDVRIDYFQPHPRVVAVSNLGNDYEEDHYDPGI